MQIATEWMTILVKSTIKLKIDKEHNQMVWLTTELSCGGNTLWLGQPRNRYMEIAISFTYMFILKLEFISPFLTTISNTVQ